MLPSTERSEEPLILYARIPGPDRKRTPSCYVYRLTYRDLETAGPCCIMVWEVAGGRMEYQIALERDAGGTLRLHCTCADAIYRGENEARFCKHIRGLLHPELPREEQRELPHHTCIGA